MTVQFNEIYSYYSVTRLSKVHKYDQHCNLNSKLSDTLDFFCNTFKFCFLFFSLHFLLLILFVLLFNYSVLLQLSKFSIHVFVLQYSFTKYSYSSVLWLLFYQFFTAYSRKTKYETFQFFTFYSFVQHELHAYKSFMIYFVDNCS